MLAGGCASRAACRGIDVADRIQICEGVMEHWAAIIETNHMWHVVVAEAVHLATPISNIVDRQHGITSDLHFRPETGLLDVTGTLVRVLRAKLNLSQVKARASNLVQGEAVLQLEHGTGATLIQLHVLQERRVQLQNTLRADAAVVLIEHAVSAPPNHAIA